MRKVVHKHPKNPDKVAIGEILPVGAELRDGDEYADPRGEWVKLNHGNVEESMLCVRPPTLMGGAETSMPTTQFRPKTNRNDDPYAV